MGYRVHYGKAAERYLDRQTPQTQKRVMDAIDALPEGCVRKLPGRNSGRLAVGGVRVLFDYVADKRIDVIEIAPRGGITAKYKVHLILLFLNALNWIVLGLYCLCEYTSVFGAYSGALRMFFMVSYALEYIPGFIVCFGTVIMGAWLVYKRRLHIILFLLLLANVVLFVPTTIDQALPLYSR